MSEVYRDEKFNAFVEELRAEAQIEDTEPSEEDASCEH